MRAPHTDEQLVSADVWGAAVTQSHVKLPTLGEHQVLFVRGFAGKLHHESDDSTLVGSGFDGLGRLGFFLMTCTLKHASGPGLPCGAETSPQRAAGAAGATGSVFATGLSG